jgi:hypothetical protein
VVTKLALRGHRLIRPPHSFENRCLKSLGHGVPASHRNCNIAETHPFSGQGDRRPSILNYVFLISILITGCATRPTQQTPVADVPEEGLLTHRAVLAARGKGEFALTGYLAVSRSRGMRLVVSENFGGQLADVLVKPDGSVHVIKAGPMLKREWIEKYVAGDLKCIFGKPAKPCHVTVLGPDHFVIKHFIYRLDLRIVATTPGPQPASVFEVNPAANK